ncbi:MAG: nucleotide exchange factor GrpE [Candidatus Lightella neohaematopini]|nr:nucleotide exchange factor GrpE [Candidatus Lightella neohaematopini]
MEISKEQSTHDDQKDLENQENSNSQEFLNNSNLEQSTKLDVRDQRINELELSIIELKQKERDYVLRAKAEIENIRRRSIQDIEKAHKFALENFMIELLPVIDNLERALITIGKDDALSSTKKGIELTLQSLISVMRKFGLDLIDENLVQFDPSIHQAINIDKSGKYEPNQVICIVQKGYTLNKRLIRPAIVTVSR